MGGSPGAAHIEHEIVLVAQDLFSSNSSYLLVRTVTIEFVMIDLIWRDTNPRLIVR
jgi:hypothetical protein